jgi:hypothetical protein
MIAFPAWDYFDAIKVARAEKPPMVFPARVNNVEVDGSCAPPPALLVPPARAVEPWHSRQAHARGAQSRSYPGAWRDPGWDLLNNVMVSRLKASQDTLHVFVEARVAARVNPTDAALQH